VRLLQSINRSRKQACGVDWLMNRRRRQAEWMDEDRADPEELLQSLRFIRRVNSLLGYTRAILHHLEQFARTWKPGDRIDIIDLATGSADIPRAILAWADRRGFDVHIVAVDRHPVTIHAAAAGGSDPRLRIVQADVFALPFADGMFDYAMTAMFMHHLDGAQIIRLLKVMDRLSRRGILAADLLRHRRAYLWIRLLTLLSTPMVRHDAAASVAQALTKSEVLSIRERAGVGYARYARHFAHRFVLAGQKRSDRFLP
jgi:ubiquinone/menaquinone biosynthesis C-methylase UbiE